MLSLALQLQHFPKPHSRRPKKIYKGKNAHCYNAKFGTPPATSPKTTQAGDQKNIERKQKPNPN